MTAIPGVVRCSGHNYPLLGFTADICINKTKEKQVSFYLPSITNIDGTKLQIFKNCK
jgi:hypothetical protein